MSNSTVNNSTQTAEQTSEYFDLHVSAFGYLNRFREVTIRQNTFCSITVAALHGKKDKVEYTWFDVIIRNKEVCALLKEYIDQINNKDIKVLASVTLSDIYAETFGEPAKATIKGRLIDLKMLSVAGKTVFNSKPVEPEQSVDSEMNQVISDLSDSDQYHDEIIRSVRLDPSIEFYEAQKQDLMSQGYVFDSKQGIWVLYKKTA